MITALADTGSAAEREPTPTELSHSGVSVVPRQRAYRVSATPLGEGGWRGWTEHSVVACVLRRGEPDDLGWRVAGYEVRQVGM
ncbi:hypothetical protein J3R08_002574 [Micromonospora sp. HB375]|nr:hypothetical protein [Micromonospora sp. HB375]MDH6472028.1 hypothetical protein [Micromonospora sp. H404/HB375]